MKKYSFIFINEYRIVLQELPLGHMKVTRDLLRWFRLEFKWEFNKVANWFQFP